MIASYFKICNCHKRIITAICFFLNLKELAVLRGQQQDESEDRLTSPTQTGKDAEETLGILGTHSVARLLGLCLEICPVL